MFILISLFWLSCEGIYTLRRCSSRDPLEMASTSFPLMPSLPLPPLLFNLLVNVPLQTFGTLVSGTLLCEPLPSPSVIFSSLLQPILHSLHAQLVLKPSHMPFLIHLRLLGQLKPFNYCFLMSRDWRLCCAPLVIDLSFHCR